MKRGILSPPRARLVRFIVSPSSAASRECVRQGRATAAPSVGDERDGSGMDEPDGMVIAGCGGPLATWGRDLHLAGAARLGTGTTSLGQARSCVTPSRVEWMRAAQPAFPGKFASIGDIPVHRMTDMMLFSASHHRWRMPQLAFTDQSLVYVRRRMVAVRGACWGYLVLTAPEAEVIGSSWWGGRGTRVAFGGLCSWA